MFRIHFLDVGRGDSIILEFENGRTYLIDSNVSLSIPKELHEWLKCSATKHNKTQSLYLTEILELVKKLQDHA